MQEQKTAVVRWLVVWFGDFGSSRKLMKRALGARVGIRIWKDTLQLCMLLAAMGTRTINIASSWLLNAHGPIRRSIGYTGSSHGHI